MLHCFVKHNFTKFTEEEYNERLDEFTKSDKNLKDLMSIYDKETLIDYIVLLNKKNMMFKETILELDNYNENNKYLICDDSVREFKKIADDCFDELIKNYGKELRHYFEVNNIRDYADVTDIDIINVATKVGILNLNFKDEE